MVLNYNVPLPSHLCKTQIFLTINHVAKLQSIPRFFQLRKERIPFVLAALACLILGILTGLARLGWEISISNATPHHGAVMIGTFLGTLITLEKIIPLKNRLLFLLPAFSVTSALMFLLDYVRAGHLSLIVASIGLSVVSLLYLARHGGMNYTIMLAGSLCWLAGNIRLAMTNSYPLSVPWWTAFVLFIILSERIDLMKFLPLSENDRRPLYLLVILYLASCLLSFHGIGAIVAGIAIAGISIWLLRFDVIAISLRKTGIIRFNAIALLVGYFNLMLTALFMLTHSLSGLLSR